MEHPCRLKPDGYLLDMKASVTYATVPVSKVHRSLPSEVIAIGR